MIRVYKGSSMIMKYIKKLVVFLLATYLIQFGRECSLYALTVGSNTVPSRQSLITFPAPDTDNRMLGFAAFNNGFRLADASTTCTYDNFIAVAGNIRLNGGLLILRQDIILNNGMNLINTGRVTGNNYRFEFAKTTTDLSLPILTTTTPMTFDNTAIVFNSNITFRAPMQFRNSCSIYARGKRLTLSKTGPFVLRPNAKLVIHDAEIYGFADNNLRCLTDAGDITFRNCRLVLARDYTFSRGAMLFQKDVLLTGTNSFLFTGARTCTIDNASTLYIDDSTTFQYAPRVAKRNLLFMTDITSQLFMNGCTLSTTRTGLDLSLGNLFIENKVTWSSQGLNSAEGILLKSDLNITMLSGATLNVFGFLTTA